MESSRSPIARRERSRSPMRSRSRSPLREDRGRSRSRTPDRLRSRSRTPERRRISRSPPRQRAVTHPTAEPSNVLGVFGLSHYTRQRDLEDLYRKFGTLKECTLVVDRRSGNSRGFGFVYFENQEDAERALKETNGITLDGRAIRVDFSVTKKAHEPTPGVYMGERRDRSPVRRGGRYDRDYRDRDRDRYRRSYRSRSRSRSRSPRRRSRSRDRYYDDRRRRFSRSRSRSR